MEVALINTIFCVSVASLCYFFGFCEKQHLTNYFNILSFLFTVPFIKGSQDRGFVIVFSYFAHVVIALVCPSDLAWAANPSSLYITFFSQITKASSEVNGESPKAGRLKSQQAEQYTASLL